MKLLNLDFNRLGHDTFRIAGSKVFYTDPYQLSKRDSADFVTISHHHFDHLAVEDLLKVVSPKTVIVASPQCKKDLAGLKVKEVRLLHAGERTAEGSVTIEGVEAYNLNKFREPGKVFHPKEEQHLGYIITLDGTRVYFAGDTDLTSEMKSVRCDIALLPVSGTYVMTADEAAEAAKVINPKIAVPMHYGAIVGSDADAQKFKSLVKNCQVEII